MKPIQRTFIPGSPWLYLKIYAGSKTMDELLAHSISSIVKKLKQQDVICKWFFIRYADPDKHLRIRILMKNQPNLGEIINYFHSNLNKKINEGLIWKIQLDTYNRELERYGNKMIEHAESVFSADSDCILSIIKILYRIRNENYRWMIALRLIDDLLNDFSIGIEGKQKLMDSLSTSFKKEFGFNEFNAKQFNIKFRDNKKIIESILNHTIDNADFNVLEVPVKQRSKKLKVTIKQLQNETKKEKYNTLTNSLLASYIHMSLNRLFRSKNRMHELVIYDFMRRFYNSEIAKAKNINN